MSIIWGLLIVVFSLGCVYFALYIWGLGAVNMIDDLKTLHKIQGFVIWGPIASKKLETIYSKQLEECTTAEEAERIRHIAESLSQGLYVCAHRKWADLSVVEIWKEIENAREDEGKLLNLLRKVAYNSLPPVREFEGVVTDSLRPFTEKRIREATTVRELVDLKGKQGVSMFPAGDEISRIDVHLSAPYMKKLRQLVLEGVIQGNKTEHLIKLCFNTRTEDPVVDELIELKKSLLAPTVIARPNVSSRALADVNFELRLFLE